MDENHAPGNIVVLAFAFMMLVLVSLYTAVTCEWWPPLEAACGWCSTCLVA